MHLQVEDSAHEIETMLQLPDSTYVHGSIPLQGKDVRIGFKGKVTINITGMSYLTSTRSNQRSERGL